MKTKWFSYLLIVSMLLFSGMPMAGSITGMVSAASAIAPMLEKGPLAESAGITTSSESGGPSYSLRTCQVIGYPGVVGTCYDPYQMRMAYGIDSLISAGYDGTGKTIVIVDAFQSPNIIDQLNYFDSYYGLPSLNGLGGPYDASLGTFTQVAPDGLTPFVTGDGNMTGWAEEISLDVLWAHAIAPGANIVLELGTDNSDEALVSALNDAINNQRGDVVSMSFGESDTCLSPDLTNDWHQAFVNATKQGITLFASSGDEGAAQPTCDGNSWIKSTSSPASDPLVTGVGGTELSAAGFCFTTFGCDPGSNPAAGTYLSEIGWNEGDPYGDFGDVFGLGTIAGGGGFSTVWDEPAYQQGTIHGGKQRGVSDVSYNAAVLHGVLTYLDIPGLPVGFYRFGGTSAGSPQWAAILAIADQMAGQDFGFINAALYKIGQGKPHYSAAFNDVTSGTNSALEFDSASNQVDITGYAAGTGWDAFTGLGTPKTGSLLSQLDSFWSAGQGNAAINGSKPHTHGNASAPGHMKNH